MPNSPFPVEQLRNVLLSWFDREGKSYPWRETTDPWYIIVSEIMLQQTTIPTVLARYDKWMDQFPTPQALANADEETALRSWEGLGYYRRVKSLRQIAQAVVEKHGGIFPSTPSELMSLPGIGQYTCGALLSFAFNIPAPIVDTNVSRVISRILDYRQPVDSLKGKKYMWARAEEWVDPHNPRAFNSAMMELGQTYCKSTSVDCLLCPARSFCRAKDPLSLPLKTEKAKPIPLTHHDIICIRDGKILLNKQLNGRHQGMYRLPERDEQEVQNLKFLARQKYSITKYKVTRSIYLATNKDTPRNGEIFVEISSLPNLPMASPDRKILGQSDIARLLEDAE